MLAPITEATFGEDALLRLNLASAAAYPAFLRDLAAATGRSLQSGAPGTLFVALDRDQLEALERLYEFQRGLGLAVEWLRGSRCRELEPALHPAVRAGVGAAEKEVDPRALTAALRCAVGAAGGLVRRHRRCAKGGGRCRSAGEGPDPPPAAPPGGGPPDSPPPEDRGGLPRSPELPGARR